uniref:DUF192 domain-containing protein n=1 Tax=Desulfobacca acetoxidans TaxID=60893 RepID=A0A7V4GA15_9BACT
MQARWHSPSILVILAAWAVFGGAAGAAGQEYSLYGNLLAPLTVKGVPLKVEVVSTPEKHYLGLSHRPGLPPGQGMLFIFPEAEYQTFCMRDMRFAIDIIWIEGGKVVGFHENLAPGDPRNFQSPAPVSLVLEVPAGFARRHGLKPGDAVEFQLPEARPHPGRQ